MEQKFNGTVQISCGVSRTDKSWKNYEISWYQLLQKCASPVRTPETYSEYLRMSKDNQDAIKDVGGFVGGPINGGQRKAKSVLYRTVITLDIDFGTMDFWDNFLKVFPNTAAFLYSTHKHSTETPRFRLVLPMDRRVLSDEYEAVSRLIAGYLNIDLFDPTTFQPSRLMYWPSSASNGEFYFRYNDGSPIPVDFALSRYADWKDYTQWPVPANAKAQVRSVIDKQASPLEKGGVIGAFCNAYSISQAIEEFLEDVYEPTSEGRYSYIHGSTSNGVVTYDDLFSYSHHSTDPTCEKLCNAFDLVRLHRFGYLDDDDTNMPINKRPSYDAMCEFASKDAKVLEYIGKDRLQKAQQYFGAVIPNVANIPHTGPSVVDYTPHDTGEIVAPEYDNTWLTLLDADKKGNYKSSIYNAFLILSKDPMLCRCFGFDEFRQRKTILCDLPWRKVTPYSNFLMDSDLANLRRYFEVTYKITGKGVIEDGFDSYVAANTFHPVKNYLDSLTWDGHPRLDTLLVDYQGAIDSAYTRAVTRKTLTAAVARIYSPGCKFDYGLTLCGPEGKRKSSLVKKLGGQWFSDSLTTVVGKEAYEQIQGYWIIEGAEMAALKRAERQHIKNFMSKSEDNFRPAFGRNTVHLPRQCILIFTSNESEPLTGSDGNRRWWVVDIAMNKAQKQIEEIDEYTRGQIFAEAKFRYLEGEKLYLDETLEVEANHIQKQHGEIDDRAGIIQEYLETLVPEDWDRYNPYQRRDYFLTDPGVRAPGKLMRQSVCIAEVWVEALGNEIKTISTHNTKSLHEVLKKLDGWQPSRLSKSRFKYYGLQKSYIRSN